MKILLISPDIIYGKEIQDILKKKAYDIRQASDNMNISVTHTGPRADIIIIDNRENHADTLVLCRQLRETRKETYL